MDNFESSARFLLNAHNFNWGQTSIEQEMENYCSPKRFSMSKVVIKIKR